MRFLETLFNLLQLILTVVSVFIILCCWIIASWINNKLGLKLDNWGMLKLTLLVPLYIPLIPSTVGSLYCMTQGIFKEIPWIMAWGLALPCIATYLFFG